MLMPLEKQFLTQCVLTNQKQEVEEEVSAFPLKAKKVKLCQYTLSLFHNF